MVYDQHCSILLAEFFVSHFIFVDQVFIDPTFSGIFVCGPLQSFVVNVCILKGYGAGPRGGASPYKTLSRSPGTSIFAEFLKTPCSYTEQGEIIVNKISTAFFFVVVVVALNGKFPGVATLELSNPPGWERKKRVNALSSVNTATFFIDRTVE